MRPRYRSRRPRSRSRRPRSHTWWSRSRSRSARDYHYNRLDSSRDQTHHSVANNRKDYERFHDNSPQNLCRYRDGSVKNNEDWGENYSQKSSHLVDKRIVQLAGPAKRRLGGFTSTSVADKDLLSNSEKDLSEGELLSDGETQVEAMNYSYIQRLMLVHNIMGLEIEQEQELVSTDFGSRKMRPKVKLPPALGFPEMFEAYMGEIKAIEGSKRGGKDPKLPLDVLKVPIRLDPTSEHMTLKEAGANKRV